MSEYAFEPTGETVKPFLPIINDQEFIACLDRSSIALSIAEDSEIHKALKTVSEDVAEYLPPGYEDSLVLFTGFAYALGGGGLPEKQSTFVALESMEFIGIKQLPVGGRRQVVFGLKSPGAHESGQTGVFMVIPSPHNVWNMDFIPEVEVPTTYSMELVDRLQELALHATDMTDDEEFLHEPRARRKAMLDGVVSDAMDAIENVIESEATSNVECGCISLYVLRDGSPVKNIMELYHSNVYDGERIVVRGNRWKALYPEALPYIGSQFESLDNFSIGQGSPCLSIRDDVNGYTYWIPLQNIGFMGWRAQ